VTRTLRFIPIVAAIFAVAACGASKPGEDSLRESFAQQLSANKFIKDFQKSGEDLTFTGPGAEGGTAMWKVRIESATIEDNNDPAKPYIGNVKSAWFSDGQPVLIRGRESHLPIELLDNGLAQECHAFWEKDTKKWSWE